MDFRRKSNSASTTASQPQMHQKPNENITASSNINSNLNVAASADEYITGEVFDALLDKLHNKGQQPPALVQKTDVSAATANPPTEVTAHASPTVAAANIPAETKVLSKGKVATVGGFGAQCVFHGIETPEECRLQSMRSG